MGRTYRNRQHRHANAKPTAREFIAQLSGQPDHLQLGRMLRSIGFRNPNDLRPAQFRRTGRGICAMRPIEAGAELIRLPFDALITLATLERDAQFCALLSVPELEHKLSIQTLLAVYLVWRQHRQSDADRDAYMRSIPRTFSMPAFCSKAELLLLPEQLFERVFAQNADLTRAHQALSAALVDRRCACCDRPFADVCPLASLKWAYFAVNSRSVFVDPAGVQRCCAGRALQKLLRDAPNTALAPFFDLLNHSDRVQPQRPEMFVPRVPAGQKCVPTAELSYALRTTTAFGRYEQVFISYGALDNARLLLEYGFVLAANRHDCVRLTLDDVTAYLERGVARRDRRPIQRNRFKFVRENGLDVELFVSRDDGLSHNLLVVLTILFVEQIAHFSNVLSVVGFGQLLPVEPVADIARRVLLFKCEEFERAERELQALPDESRSASGTMVGEFLRESVRLMRDVVREYLPEQEQVNE